MELIHRLHMCTHTHTHSDQHNRKPLSTTQLNLSLVMEMICGWLVWSKLHPWTPGFFQMQKDLLKIIINREMLPWQHNKQWSGQKLRDRAQQKKKILCSQACQKCSDQNFKFSKFSISALILFFFFFCGGFTFII